MHITILIITNDRAVRFQNSDYLEKWIHHSDGHTIERMYMEIFMQVLCIVQQHLQHMRDMLVQGGQGNSYVNVDIVMEL